MGHRVPPRRESPICSEEVSVPGLEPDLLTIHYGFPLDGGVEPPRQSLEHFPAGHAEEVRLVGGSEVLAEAALESDDVVGFGYDLDGPPCPRGRPVSFLGDGLLVLLR